MGEYLIKKIKIVLTILCLIIFSGCEDLFVRFKYETYQCKPNRANLNKIFIKNIVSMQKLALWSKTKYVDLLSFESHFARHAKFGSNLFTFKS